MTSLEDAAVRISRGEPLSDGDAAAILRTHDLVAVGILGDEVRRRFHGLRTTFVRVFEVHVDAPPAELPAALQAGELRLVGAPRNLDAAVDVVRALASRAPGLPLTGFSLADLWALVPAAAAMEDACRRLREAGLVAVAGVPLDRLDDAGDAVLAARLGGLRVARLTVEEIPDGHRVAAVTRARDLQQTLGGFHAFAPLPRRISASLPTTGYDDVKQVALARVVVTNVPSIQVDWRDYGPKLAQVALTMGADDVDRIEAVDERALGTRRTPLAEIFGNIRAAGLEPQERDGLFQVRQ